MWCTWIVTHSYLEIGLYTHPITHFVAHPHRQLIHSHTFKMRVKRRRQQLWSNEKKPSNLSSQTNEYIYIIYGIRNQYISTCTTVFKKCCIRRKSHRTPYDVIQTVLRLNDFSTSFYFRLTLHSAMRAYVETNINTRKNTSQTPQTR